MTTTMSLPAFGAASKWGDEPGPAIKLAYVFGWFIPTNLEGRTVMHLGQASPPDGVPQTPQIHADIQVVTLDLQKGCGTGTDLELNSVN